MFNYNPTLSVEKKKGKHRNAVRTRVSVALLYELQFSVADIHCFKSNRVAIEIKKKHIIYIHI